MRLSTLALLGAVTISSAPAVGAQTLYSRFASQAELADQGRFPNVQPTCINVSNGTTFFDETSRQILRYFPNNSAGSRTEVVLSSADLDRITGTTVTQCVDADGGIISTYVLSNAANEDFVLSTVGGSQNQLISSGPNANGITGIIRDAVRGRTYVTRSQAEGAPEDGVYRASSTGYEAVVLNADLDLVALDLSQGGDLYATSGKNGAGLYKNKIVRVVDPNGASTLQIVADPFAGPTPLFTNGDDGGLGDIFVDEQGNVERIFVLNNSFGAPTGETIGRYNLNGSTPVLAFSEAGLIASPPAMATPTSAFTPVRRNGTLTRFLTTNQNGQVSNILLASRGTNNGQVAIFSADVTNLPTPAEETAASAAGYAIEMANPVRGAVSVRLVQPEAASVRASVVDVLGREVAVLAEGSRAASSVATFDASGLAPGVYHVVLRSGGFATMRSITVVR